MNTLARLRELVEAEGEPLAGELHAAVPAGVVPRLGAIAARGPRAAEDPGEYEFLFEAIYEGFLLHYGRSRLLVEGDEDLSLLAGDRLYALGLERLVALGDLEAVQELADVISLCALLIGRGDDDTCEPLWGAAAQAVGWGAGEAYLAAKALARSGDRSARAALLALDAPRAMA
ncbi:MAG TPA: hypothetical protein VKS25_08630 [Solirubrobacteraceae bacterium]|nr:hypothetical protein [Solirubrobacteraceae bacterium]